MHEVYRHVFFQIFNLIFLLNIVQEVWISFHIFRDIGVRDLCTKFQNFLSIIFQFKDLDIMKGNTVIYAN